MRLSLTITISLIVYFGLISEGQNRYQSQERVSGVGIRSTVCSICSSDGLGTGLIRLIGQRSSQTTRMDWARLEGIWSLIWHLVTRQAPRSFSRRHKTPLNHCYAPTPCNNLFNLGRCIGMNHEVYVLQPAAHTPVGCEYRTALQYRQGGRHRQPGSVTLRAAWEAGTTSHRSITQYQ